MSHQQSRCLAGKGQFDEMKFLVITSVLFCLIFTHPTKGQQNFRPRNLRPIKVGALFADNPRWEGLGFDVFLMPGRSVVTGRRWLTRTGAEYLPDVMMDSLAVPAKHAMPTKSRAKFSLSLLWKKGGKIRFNSYILSPPELPTRVVKLLIHEKYSVLHLNWTLSRVLAIAV